MKLTAAGLLLIAYFIYSTGVSAQRISIRGVVQDTSAHKPVEQAVAMAIRLRDSLLISFSRSNSTGFFQMDSLPVDTYQVVVSHPQFGDKDLILLGDKNTPVIDLLKISLPPKTITLNEVTVFGYADPVYYNGDTLVYTADSFQVKKNAVVEDLLKKLPGIRVEKDGKIYSQGKKVDQVLVDGDEFFGSDPTIATKNLAAGSVESVQVYDKKNEDANESSADETLKIMNLKLKDEAKKGYFGKTSLAGDFSKYYEGEMLFNRFEGERKISVFGLASNTPRSAFGWNDIYQYGLQDENNYTMTDDGYMVSYSNNQRPQGIPKTIKTGFYYTDKISAKTKVSFNYSYGMSGMNADIHTTSQYFLTDSTYETVAFQHSSHTNTTHTANLVVKHNLDSLTDIEIQSRFKYALTDQDQAETNTFIDSAHVLNKFTDTHNTNSGNNSDLNNSVKLTRNFKKKDRRLTVFSSLEFANSRSDGLLQSTSLFYNNAVLPDEYIDQKKINTSRNTNLFGSLTYQEPLSKRIKLEISGDFSSSNGNQNRQTLNYSKGVYDTEIPELSNNFKSTRSIQRLGEKLSYEVRKYSLSIGARERDVKAENSNLVTNERISQDVKNILPYLTYRYKFSDNQSLNLRYTTGSDQPALSQLQPVPDNSNPNYIVKGNPDLLPSYTHRFDLALYAFKPVTGRNIWSDINFSSTNNAFANSSSLDSLGRTTSRTVNVQGNYTFNSYLNFTFPLLSRMLTLQPGADYSYSRSTSYINGLKNMTTRSGPEASLDVEVRIDTFEFSVGGNYGRHAASSTLNSLSNQSYTTYSYNSSLSLELPLKLKIETEITYEANTQRVQGYNLHSLLWNASLEKKFLKNEKLVLSIDATDILNQNINTYREVQDNAIADIRTNVIGRYILLKLVFKFSSDKKHNEEEEDEE